LRILFVGKTPTPDNLAAGVSFWAKLYACHAGSRVLGTIRFQTLQFRTLRLAFTDAYRGSPESVFKQGKYLRRACPGECWYVIEKGVNSTSGFWQHTGIFEDIDLVIAGRVVRAFPFRKLPKMLCLWAGEPRNLWGHNIKHLAKQIRRGNWARRRMPAEWIACDMAIYRQLASRRRAVSLPDSDLRNTFLPLAARIAVFVDLPNKLA